MPEPNKVQDALKRSLQLDLARLQEKVPYPTAKKANIRLDPPDLPSWDWGRYNPMANEVSIDTRERKAGQPSIEETTGHELGHAVYTKDLDPFYRAFWDRKFSPQEQDRRASLIGQVMPNGMMYLGGYPGTSTPYLEETKLKRGRAEHPFAEAFGRFLTRPKDLPDDLYSAMLTITGMDTRGK